MVKSSLSKFLTSEFVAESTRVEHNIKTKQYIKKLVIFKLLPKLHTVSGEAVIRSSSINLKKKEHTIFNSSKRHFGRQNSVEKSSRSLI
jgi:hypothetical protein